jgi:hypothetical protein
VHQDQQVNKIPIVLFEDLERWPPHVRESFGRYQGQVSAPIFQLSWRFDERVLHYPLKNQLVLPFVHEEDVIKDLTETALSVTTAHSTQKIVTLELSGDMMQRFGGTSIVRRTKIHPAHYMQDHFL